MTKYIKSEKGSTHIVIFGILLAAVFLSFVFVDLYTGFMNKRVSQTSADAAVLAAAEEMKNVYEEELLEELELKLEQVRSIVERKVAEETEGSDDNNDDELDERELKNLYRKLLKEMFAKNPPASLIAWLYDRTYEMDPNELLPFLFADDEINEMVCSAIFGKMNEIRRAAQYYADENGAKGDIELAFPYEEPFEVFVRVKTEASFTTVDASQMGDGNEVHAQASAKVKNPAGVEIRCG